MNIKLIPYFIVFCVVMLIGTENSFADAPGTIYHIKVEDLPKPYATKSVSRSVDRISREETMRPIAPEGFSVTLFAEGITHPRHMVVTEAGDIFLAQPRLDQIARLRDRDGDQVMDQYRLLDHQFNSPHGMDIHNGKLYVADLDRLYRIDLSNVGRKPKPMGKVGILGDQGGHWTRNLAISPDGKAAYVAIGSWGNIDEEASPKATVQRFDITSSGGLSNQRDFATGLRNPVGLTFHPDTGILYTVVNERDGMGDGLVPDYLTEVLDGDFYGWPYAYSGTLPQPGFADKRPDLVAKSKKPDVLFQSHSAPIGLIFLRDANVPEGWKDDALVTFRGSWNAGRPTGYKVVRVPFENGKPTGEYIDFLTGFRMNPDEVEARAIVWGRPTGLAVMPNGDILVSDDTGGTIWSVRWVN